MPSKETYLAAIEFRKAKLWDYLYDDELFAVTLADGKVGYVSILGMEREMFALVLYPGSAALDTYRRLNLAEENEDDLSRLERLTSQDALLCSFEVKSDLDADSLREISKFGLGTLRGAGPKYPCFRRARPHQMPWVLEDAADEANMVLALRAGIEVARRIVEIGGKYAKAYGDATKQLGFLSDIPFDRDVPLLTPRADGGFDWDMAPLPVMAPSTFEKPIYADEVAIRRLANAKKRDAWEFEVFQAPSPVFEEGDPAPYMPMICFVVRHSDGMVLRMAVSKGPGTYGADLLAALVSCAEEHGMPAFLYVRDARSRAVVEDFATRTGIRLSTEKKLELMAEVREDFIKHMDDSHAESLDATLKAIEELPPDEMSDEMLDMLQFIADSEDIPDEQRARIEQILAKMGL